MRVVLSARARTDILDIYANIGGRDPAAADRFLDAVSAAATRISSFPEIGSTRLWKNPALRDTRAWPVPAFPKYILYYRPVSPGHLRILRVLHGAVPAENILRTPP